MARCGTGAGRIPKYISDKVSAIVHKTGTGFALGDGTVTGINDIACIILPDGKMTIFAAISLTAVTTGHAGI